MIARLRERHARMWGALLVLVPAVLMAALSVRRGEAARQELPATLLSETAPATEPVPRSDVRWRRDEASGRRVLVMNDWPTDLQVAGEPDLLLYWCSSAGGRGPYTWSAGDAPRPLPPDAVLLGPWLGGRVNSYLVPESLDEGEGGFVWDSLGLSSVVHEPPRADILPADDEPAR